jgi:hypothetical protein
MCTRGGHLRGWPTACVAEATVADTFFFSFLSTCVPIIITLPELLPSRRNLIGRKLREVDNFHGEAWRIFAFNISLPKWEHMKPEVVYRGYWWQTRNPYHFYHPELSNGLGDIRLDLDKHSKSVRERCHVRSIDVSIGYPHIAPRTLCAQYTLQ